MKPILIATLIVLLSIILTSLIWMGLQYNPVVTLILVIISIWTVVYLCIKGNTIY
jgi:hypothetical protein